MKGLEHERLPGACYDLPLPIVDKYFQSNGNTERFEHRTGKAICGSCAVRQICLVEAIETPIGHGVRGGESAKHIREMNAVHVSQGVPAEVLAAEAIARQKPLGGVQGLRAGHFADVPLVGAAS